MAKKDVKLSRVLKEELARYAPVEELDQLTQELMGKGESRGLTNAELIAQKVVAIAREGKQWAVEFCRDTNEGKPVQAVRHEDADRSTEQRIRDVTTQHLNSIARKFSPSSAESAPAVRRDEPRTEGPGSETHQPASEPIPAASGETTAAARRLLALPSNRDRNPKNAGSEPPLA